MSATPTPADVWRFGDPQDRGTTYADGTTVPERTWTVYHNDVAIGSCTVHLHRRRGDDGQVDVSFGHTDIVFGLPPAGGS